MRRNEPKHEGTIWLLGPPVKRQCERERKKERKKESERERERERETERDRKRDRERGRAIRKVKKGRKCKDK